MNRLTSDRATRRMSADPETVYGFVSDVTRTPSWSPEVVACRWLDGATGAVVGARFAATNRRRWLTWTNQPVVVAVEPGREFAVDRTERGGGTMRWTYTLTPVEAGTDVALSYEVLKPVPVMLHVILRLFLGCPDLEADLHRNLEASLARVAALTDAGTVLADRERDQ